MKVILLHLLYIPLAVVSIRFNRMHVSTTRTPPAAAAFFNPRSKSKPLPAPTTKKIKPLPSVQELIIVPSFLTIATTYLAPLTQQLCNTISTATKECKKNSNRAISCIIEKTRQSVKTLNKNMNNFNTLCTSIVKNISGAMIEFGEQIGQGSLDLICGTKAWIKTISIYAYCKVISPSMTNTIKFISQVSDYATTWIENLTIYTINFTSTILEDISHFVIDFSLDALDLIQHYSSVSYLFFMKYVRFVSSSVFQSILHIPIWINGATQVTFRFLALVVTRSKKVSVTLYNDFLDLTDKIIDIVPFFIRYEEDGKKIVSLTPTTQMVLYILSTIYAAQPLLIPGMNAVNSKPMLKNVVSSIQTRFFPPRTLICVGALARGLQHSSTLRKSFNPTVGAGAMINFFSAFLEEQWLSYIVTGWFVSGGIWTLFGSPLPQKEEKDEPKRGWWM